jgi:hypothetical protein
VVLVVAQLAFPKEEQVIQLEGLLVESVVTQ